jgi:GAF domain-containing protein
MRAALVELIFSRGVALGVVEIASKGATTYSETDVVIFKQVVNQIGIAIENAQAYMQSQRIARSKALVNEISTQLQRQVDIDSILNVTASELGRALGARRARIRLATQSDVATKELKESRELKDVTGGGKTEK